MQKPTRRICVSSLSEIWSRISRLSLFTLLPYRVLLYNEVLLWLLSSTPLPISSPETYAAPFPPYIHSPPPNTLGYGLHTLQCLPPTPVNLHLPSMCEFPLPRMFLTRFPRRDLRVPATSYRRLSLAESAGRRSKVKAKWSGRHILKPPSLKVSCLLSFHGARPSLTIYLSFLQVWKSIVLWKHDRLGLSVATQCEISSSRVCTSHSGINMSC